MTLATTCPHCKTSFRVVADQLKLRKGLVRCGRCQEVFSGVDALTYLDETLETQPPETQPPETPLPETQPPEAQNQDTAEASVQRNTAAVTGETIAPSQEASFAEPASVPDWAVSEGDAPAVIKRHSRMGKVMALLLILASLGVLGQALLGWRHELAYRMPVLIPLMTQLGQPLGLDLHPPLDAGALTIESIQLVSAEDPSKIALEAVIRNRSDRPVAFPAIELTLRDTQSVMITRKVIPAEVYAPPAERRAGLPSRSEWPLQIALEHEGLAVAGYAAVLFHP